MFKTLDKEYTPQQIKEIIYQFTQYIELLKEA